MLVTKVVQSVAEGIDLQQLVVLMSRDDVMPNLDMLARRARAGRSNYGDFTMAEIRAGLEQLRQLIQETEERIA